MPAILMVSLAAACQLALAAHALRGGDLPLCLALAAPLAGLALRLGAARLVCAGALVLGAAHWAGTAVNLAQLRMAFGEPWLRMALILGALCLASLAAGLWLLGARARQTFDRGGGAQADETAHAVQAAAFLLAAGILALARGKASMAVLLADRFLPGSGWLEILALASYAGWLAGRILDPRAHKRLRPIVWAAFSAVFFGQLALGLAGLSDFLMTGRLHLPVPALIAAGPLFRGGGLFMPILFSATVLLVGPAWCSHLCYIGAWDDQLSRRGPRPPRMLSPGVTACARLFTLVLACGGALLLRWAGVDGTTAALLAAGFGLAGVGVMVFASRRAGAMVHCTAFCPIGLVGNLLGRLMPWRMRIDLDACTRCGSCARACRYSALQPERIEAGRPGLSCTLCGDCVGACPHDAMHYRLGRLAPGVARAVFLTLVAALHAVFLGVARI